MDYKRLAGQYVGLELRRFERMKQNRTRVSNLEPAQRRQMNFSMSSSALALRIFARNCTSGARRAETPRPAPGLAAELRGAASRTIGEYGALTSAPAVDLELARKREISRAYGGRP